MDDESALESVSRAPIPVQNTYAEDALSANELHQLILHRANGIALGVSLEVAQVTDVALGIAGSTVDLAEGVD